MSTTFKQLQQLMQHHANPEQAKKMEAYMKNQFPFYGIPASDRKKLYASILKDSKQSAKIDWNLLNLCFQEGYREMKYFVCDYLLGMVKYLRYEDLSHIRSYILMESWWDITDSLDAVIGRMALKDERVKNDMLAWSVSDNIWLKRVAIDHQLSYKEKTDTVLLEEILHHCMGTSEFFVNKAIGWALRQYSKSDPDWVKRFIDKNYNELHSLSIKEGSKYI